MVRGNWQKRVERTEARRVAAKLKKEKRRDKHNESSSGGGRTSGGDLELLYIRLEEWLDERGDGIGVSFPFDGGGTDADTLSPSTSIVLDIWTDVLPRNRPEYLPAHLDGDSDHDEIDDHEGSGHRKKGRPKGKVKDNRRGGFRKSKGKAHPNAKNKFSQDEVESLGEEIASISTSTPKEERMCGREFYLGKAECRGVQRHKHNRQKGGRHRSGSISEDGDGGCSLRFYSRLPKAKRSRGGVPQTPPTTLSQALHEKFVPHHVRHNGKGGSPAASLPARLRESALLASFDAACDRDGSSCADMAYHSRLIVKNMVANCGQVAESEMHDKANNDEEDQSSKDKGSSSGRDGEGDGVDECNGKRNDDVRQSKIHRELLRILAEEETPPSSLLYLAIQGVLVYDRNRGGLVLSKEEERFLLFGDAISDAALAAAAENDDDADFQGGPMHVHEELTHHLLDEMLSYADEASIGSLPQVCRSWRDEAGTRTAQLWRTLLDRRGWPPAENGEDLSNRPSDITEERRRHREAYVSHYSAVRDINGIAEGCKALASGGGACTDKRMGLEFAIQSFKATRGAHTLCTSGNNSRCIVRIWPQAGDGASSRALAAYGDLTLRLFDVSRGGMCRQIACVRVSPPSISLKRSSCQMSSMNLDDEVVACFLSMVDHTGRTLPWLTLFSREDIACAGNMDGLDNERVCTFDLRAVIFEYLLETPDEEEDDLREAFQGFIATSDGNESDVQVAVTTELLACGRGHFLFHAYIHVPDLDTMNPLTDVFGHRLFLFSSKTGSLAKVVHLGWDREATSSLFGSRPFKRRTSANAGTALCTNLMIAGPAMALFLSVEIGRDGNIDIRKNSIIEIHDMASLEVDAALTASDAVFCAGTVQGPILYFKRLLTPSKEVDTASSPNSVSIGGPKQKVSKILIVREHYAIVIVTTDVEDQEDEFDGHWFGPNRATFLSEVVLYHIPTRMEMHRRPLPPSRSLSVDCLGDTLAANLSCVGFIITGGNARDITRTSKAASGADDREISSPSGKAPKGKKKRLASLASGRKKDGFARGMSMRG